MHPATPAESFQQLPDLGHSRRAAPLRKEAAGVRTTPFGEVGTIFSDGALEVVWVSKQGEAVDPDWFEQDQTDVLAVIHGELKVEFESPSLEDAVLGTGEVLVLPAGCRCRAYRWPRDATEATVFLAAYRLG